jgi:hypothetical protein
MIGITTGESICELVEAATTVGYYGGIQGSRAARSDRWIFGLSYCNIRLAVGITIATNGYIVGMNRHSLRDFLEATDLTEGDLASQASWPVDTPLTDC